MNGPSSRLLELLSLLQTGRAWPARDLAERLGTTPRTLRRDLDRLREFGYPVESARGPGGSYRLVAGRAMPPLVLTDEEAIAAVAGLRMAAAVSEAADGALRKLERVLPPRLRRRVSALSAVTHSVARRAPDLAVVDTLAVAAHARRDVRFTYRDEAGRRVEPYRVVVLDRRWYLLAWDLDRADWRTFRVDRIASVEVPGSTFAPRESLPDSMVHRGASGPRGVIDFEAPVSVVSPRLHAEAGELAAVGEDRCRYTSPPDDWAWLAAMAAMVGVPYRVEGPPELVAETERLVARAARATAPRSPA
ncbi:helix-turn-helix transcriptional regulator [Actinophytocola algeriensis]|uniref:Putative DNA-binding transcriptional regulator YafY n=1 Tax=Actinophytocola algeriensis TaxID=1768010 RepID=A0A7W7QBY4_9PSEU|nr:WYL domain-containing protein [Actinophytocola algeriensis]MBB4910735.1 putative DNA-binding transcriptional regulator YafY [Actinophytocola algeriensis]MBE1473728.1 putative DNA-binding transcriptional regulator YafY [Actinophytocola algeriensis]